MFLSLYRNTYLILNPWYLYVILFKTFLYRLYLQFLSYLRSWHDFHKPHQCYKWNVLIGISDPSVTQRGVVTVDHYFCRWRTVTTMGRSVSTSLSLQWSDRTYPWLILINNFVSQTVPGGELQVNCVYEMEVSDIC